MNVEEISKDYNKTSNNSIQKNNREFGGSLSKFFAKAVNI